MTTFRRRTILSGFIWVDLCLPFHLLVFNLQCFFWLNFINPEDIVDNLVEIYIPFKYLTSTRFIESIVKESVSLRGSQKGFFKIYFRAWFLILFRNTQEHVRLKSTFLTKVFWEYSHIIDINALCERVQVIDSFTEYFISKFSLVFFPIDSF